MMGILNSGWIVMKSIVIKFLCVFLIVISVIQIEINNKMSREKENMNSITDVHKNTSIKYKTLSKLNNELSCSKICELLGASNDGEKWKVKVRISGDVTDILNEMINLQKYEITSYRLVKNNDEKFIVLEMYGTQ